MKKIGLTTTVPIEILLTAKYIPVDLNNIFITSDDYLKYIDIAEKDGFPKNICSWIKGIYGVCISEEIEEIIGVVEGDCSNTKILTEVLSMKGIKVHPFSFPHNHTLNDVKTEIDKFMNLFNVEINEVEKTRKKLNSIRNLSKTIDKLTYIDYKATGFENHLYQVSLSDFNGNPDDFKITLKNAISDIKKRISNPPLLKLGYIGVPPMTSDLYSFVEKFNGQIIYNEVQREFAFPRADICENIYEQYYDYTYPYDNNFRIKEIKKQIKMRKLDGLIHYTQSFCHRAIEDIILKENLDIPILNIQGDKLNVLDSRTKLRLEAFMDMLLDLKRRK